MPLRGTHVGLKTESKRHCHVQAAYFDSSVALQPPSARVCPSHVNLSHSLTNTWARLKHTRLGNPRGRPIVQETESPQRCTMSKHELQHSLQVLSPCFRGRRNTEARAGRALSSAIGRDRVLSRIQHVTPHACADTPTRPPRTKAEMRASYVTAPVDRHP